MGAVCSAWPFRKAWVQELTAALQQPETQAKLAALGADAASGKASELEQVMKEDALKWGQVIRDAGVKFE